MEIISPSFLSSSGFWFDDYLSTRWTKAENKMFESALALHDKETPDRWHKVAAMIPGKTVVDVIKQYRELEDDVSNIEAGLVPFPVYESSAFTLELVNRHGFSSLKQQQQHQHHHHSTYGKRSTPSSRADMERKKGIPWTEEEHKLFLMGLKRYGKGDWRNISRNFVITRTPTQVASHAQKYFIRQLTGGKDKRRASIHDITTVSLTESSPPPPPPPSSSTTTTITTTTTCSEKNKLLLPPSSSSSSSSSLLRHWSMQRSSLLPSHGSLLIQPPPTPPSSRLLQLPLNEQPYIAGIHHDPSFIDYFVA